MSSLNTYERAGVCVLLIAGLVVAAAIVADGQTARTINGAGGIVWLLAAGLLIRAARRHPGFPRLLIATSALTLALVLAARPSDYLWSIVGFSLAGALAARLSRSSPLLSAALVPALWLPAHLLVAVARAAERALRDLPAAVRSDPPPTAAFVPLSMIVAALAAGAIVAFWRTRSPSIRAGSIGAQREA